MNPGFANQQMLDPAMLSGMMNPACPVGFPNEFGLPPQPIQ